MITIAFTPSAVVAAGRECVDTLRRFDIDVLEDRKDALTTLGVHLYVVREAELPVVEPATMGPRVMVLGDKITEHYVRGCIRDGVDAVVSSRDSPAQIALAAAAAAAGHCVVPAEHSVGLGMRLDSPPEWLTGLDRTLLRSACSMSIQSAGERVGLAPRQAQRRFRSLSDRLGVSGRAQVAATVARWGWSVH